MSGAGSSQAASVGAHPGSCSRAELQAVFIARQIKDGEQVLAGTNLARSSRNISRRAASLQSDSLTTYSPPPAVMRSPT